MSNLPSTFVTELTIPLWIVIGVCLAAGMHHIFVAFRRSQGNVNFVFSLLCFATALYTWSNICLYGSTNDELYRFYVKLQIGMSIVTGLALVWFVALYTDFLPRIALGLLTVYALGLLAYHLWLPYGIFFEEYHGVGAVELVWGGTVPYPRVEYAGGRTRLSDVNVLMHAIFIVVALFVQFRRGGRKSALMLGLAVTIFFGFSLYDVALARHVLIDRPEMINRIPLQEYGFVSLIFLMSLRLSNDVLKAASIQQALIESEENLRITLDSIGDAVITTDAEGRVRRMNPIAVSLTGWTPEESAGRFLPEIFRIVNSRTREPVPNPAEKVMETGGLVGLANHTVLIHRDGSERQIADSGAPIRNPEGEIVGVVLVFRDVTRQYLLEDQLRHSQKMEAVGRLAGGVAHDFNNLLQAIQGYTGLALSRVEDRGRTPNDLREVLKTADRAAVLVRQLLTFSRREAYTPALTDLNHMINDLIKLLKRVLGVDIELTVELDGSVRPVIADRGQLEQVIMNLCVNARDAMPGRGEIRIRTRNVTLDEDFCIERGAALPGEYVCISIADDGVGMEPEVQRHIFEPYFTTKQKGEGTGLGLATAFAIIERHEGLIDVVSVPGEGSTFSIYLHAAEEDSRIEGGGGETESPTHGTGTILLAEDEEVVRNLAVYTLERAGYTVLAAEDGHLAREIFDRRGAEIDAAVVDLMMPRVGGRALYDHMRKTRDDLPVVFCSGYTPDGLDQLLEQDRLARLLQKPHSTGDLLRAIQAVLDKIGQP